MMLSKKFLKDLENSDEILKIIESDFFSKNAVFYGDLKAEKKSTVENSIKNSSIFLSLKRLIKK